MAYLMYKDCPKILYNLYRDWFNEFSESAVSLEVSEEEREKVFLLCSSRISDISDEEIWAYSKKVMDMPNFDPETFTYTNILELKRGWNVGKQEFLNMAFIPMVKILLYYKTFQKKKLGKFILSENLGKGIFENKAQLRKWLRQSEKIEIDDAEKLVSNIEEFFKQKIGKNS